MEVLTQFQLFCLPAVTSLIHTSSYDLSFASLSRLPGEHSTARPTDRLLILRHRTGFLRYPIIWHSGVSATCILVLPSDRKTLASGHKQSGHKSPVIRGFQPRRAVPGKCDSCNFRMSLQCDNYHTRNATNQFNISF